MIEDVLVVADRQLQQLDAPDIMDQRDIDLQEDKRVTEFCTNGCGCTLVHKGPCSSQFSIDHYKTMRADCAELTWDELNMVIMGQVSVSSVVADL